MGRLIVFEGIDGSGKSTQFRKMCDRYANEGKKFERLVFPQYDEPSSALIKMYLAGEFGSDPADVNAYAASAFYAVDRYASYMKVWREYYRNGGVILSDRYTTSNAIHQACKLPPEDRKKYFEWLYDFEYVKLELPEPDKVIYMDIPVENAVGNMRAREAKTDTHGDIHETNTQYLVKCWECGRQAAEHYGWRMIRCVENGKMRSIDDIHEEIYDILSEKE